MASLQCQQETLQRLLSEAVTVLCENSLPFRDQLSVQGLLGITLDNRDVLLVDIHQRVARNPHHHWQPSHDHHPHQLPEPHKNHAYSSRMGESMAFLSKMYQRQFRTDVAGMERPECVRRADHNEADRHSDITHEKLVNGHASPPHTAMNLSHPARGDATLISDSDKPGSMHHHGSNHGSNQETKQPISPTRSPHHPQPADQSHLSPPNRDQSLRTPDNHQDLSPLNHDKSTINCDTSSVNHDECPGNRDECALKREGSSVNHDINRNVSPAVQDKMRDSISLTVSKIFAQRFEGQPPLKKRLTEIEEFQDDLDAPLNYTLCHSVKGKLRGSQKRKARVSYPLDLSKVSDQDEQDLAEWGMSSDDSQPTTQHPDSPASHQPSPGKQRPDSADNASPASEEQPSQTTSPVQYSLAQQRGLLPPHLPVSMFDSAAMAGNADMGLSLMINNLVNVYAPGLPLSGLKHDLSPASYSKSASLMEYSKSGMVGMGGSPQHSPLLSPARGSPMLSPGARGSPLGEGDSERGHKCSQCGKLVASLQGLMIHYRTHTGEKPHVCGMCGKGLSTVQGLQVHQRTHTGEKPYSCTSCGKGFNDKSNMKRHIRHCTLRSPTRFMLHANPLHMPQS